MSKLTQSTVYLQGGLGNQLFQYTFYLHLLVNNEGTKFDIGRLLYDQLHNNISVVNFLQLDKKAYSSSENESLPYLIKDSIVAKGIRWGLRTVNIRTTQSSFYDYDAMSRFEDIGKLKKNYFGYFQFVDSAIVAKSNIENRLSELYEIQLQTYSKKYAGKCGLHVRRGDFLLSNNPKHDCVGLDYIKASINNSKSDIVVFSDDINWCQENLSEFPCLEFHCGSSAFDDFLALSQCTNYILPGSTFSWWAAFLFSSSKTEIVFPKKQQAQFLTKVSNDKVGWVYSVL